VYFLTPQSADEHLLIVTLSEQESISKEAKWRAIGASGEAMSHEHVSWVVLQAHSLLALPYVLLQLEVPVPLKQLFE